MLGLKFIEGVKSSEGLFLLKKENTVLLAELLGKIQVILRLVNVFSLFIYSVFRTKDLEFIVICFSDKKKNPKTLNKMYGPYTGGV